MRVHYTKNPLKSGKIKREVETKMTLIKLQDILGERIEITLRDDFTPEQRQMENEQSNLVMELAKQMINNGDLILRAEKLAAQNKNLVESQIFKLINGNE